MSRTRVDAASLCEQAVALARLGRYHDAIRLCDEALIAKPAPEIFVERAAAKRAFKDYEGALADLDAALVLNPQLKFIPGAALSLRMRLCRWDGLVEEARRLLDLVARGEPVITPFESLTLPSSPQEQYQAAAIFFRDRVPAGQVAARPSQARGNKIRLGYFSADYCDHAVSHLIHGLFSSHDRSRFEVIAFALAGNPRDPVRQFIAGLVDEMIDVSAMSNDEIAALSREQGIHIAIDLNLYLDRQPTIFARGAAPIQVNYLGYPGTSAVDCYDYIIGDHIVTPLEGRSHFSERTVVLPHSYQVNSFSRYDTDRAFSRDELGLPKSGFVFCCFNDSFKITPDVFDIWMRLLAAVEGSVLWLLACNPVAAQNLRIEMEKRGVSSRRLVFAPRLPLVDHLARHRAADLFLDTLHYGAHTTASDALWMGLPVVTRLGETFASRVASSLLTAAWMPELIAENETQYEELALDLATHPNELALIRRRLEGNRQSCPLFDTPRYTRNIEAAYMRMWERHQAGLPPEDFAVTETRFLAKRVETNTPFRIP